MNFLNRIFARSRRHKHNTASLLAHVRCTWAHLGETDPYFSVLSADEWRLQNIGEAERNAFYASGAGDVKLLLDLCANAGVAPNFAGTCLELGCGLGRVGVHLAARFNRYIGVDISQPHLAHAARHLATQGLHNCEFQSLDRALDDDTPVDLVFTRLVLQHNPPPVIAMLIKAMCKRLKPGGLFLFQVPISLDKYRFDLGSYVPLDGIMEMHCLSERAVRRIIRANNCVIVASSSIDDIGGNGESRQFLARRN